MLRRTRLGGDGDRWQRRSRLAQQAERYGRATLLPWATVQFNLSRHNTEVDGQAFQLLRTKCAGTFYDLGQASQVHVLYHSRGWHGRLAEQLRDIRTYG